MNIRKIIVIGASAGGVEALSRLFRELKPGLNAAIFVVLHIPSNMKSSLPEILNRLGQIPVKHAGNAVKIEAGRAYIAPPDQHLILQDGFMRLVFGPRINHNRPAVDPLFESAASSYGADVIGIILSGFLDDGAQGLMTIKQAGGIAIIQDPAEALFPDMPKNALGYVQIDHILPISEIASYLNSIAKEPMLSQGETQLNETLPDFSADEVNLIKDEIESFEKGDETSQRSILTCPECGGVLWELKSQQLVRYRCHTGHVFNAQHILSSYDNAYERVFWTAIRVLVEKAAMSNRLAASARQQGDQELAAHYLSTAREAEAEAERVRAGWFQRKAHTSERESAGEQAHEKEMRSKDYSGD